MAQKKKGWSYFGLQGSRPGDIRHIFLTSTQANNHGGVVIPLRVRIAMPGERHTHWGWMNNDAERPTLIRETLRQLDYCFNKGVTSAEIAGYGQSVRLVITREDDEQPPEPPLKISPPRGKRSAVRVA